MEHLPAPVWGIIGGALAEFARWYSIRDELHRGGPEWASVGYWCVTIVMILVGGLVVVMHAGSGVEMNPYLAANLGASAPTIISTLMNNAPRTQDVEPGHDTPLDADDPADGSPEAGTPAPPPAPLDNTHDDGDSGDADGPAGGGDGEQGAS